MATDPARLRQLFQQAMNALQQGHAAEAEGFARDLLKADPGFTPNHLMGVITLQQGRAAEAVEYFATAVRLEPRDLGAAANHGLALAHTGRYAEALAVLEKVTAAAPDFTEAWFNRGLALTSLGRFAEAVTVHDQVLARHPTHAGAHYNRGIALAAQGRFAEAVISYDRVLQLVPGMTAALADRGAALMALGRAEEAFNSLDQALVGAPGNPDILAYRGQALMALGRQDAALASYDWALSSNPDNVRLLDRKGMALWDMRRHDEALECFNRALTLAPDDAEILNHRGNLLWVAFAQADAARTDLEKVVALDPAQPYAIGELLHLKYYVADWNGTEALKARVLAAVRAGASAIRPFECQAVADRPADLQACAHTFARDLFPFAQPYVPGPAPAREKLRIGYVSGEFHQQATALLTAGLYEAHDRARFEIVAIDNGIDDGSPMRARLKAAFDTFISIADLDDREAVETVRGAGIDILVDLNGWFGRHRTILFTERCAPIQVNYLGFPGTMGLASMDYLIADKIVIPPGDEVFYDEKIAWLPGSYQINDDKRAIAPATSRAAHGLPDDAFVFCNFNQSYKIHPDSFAAWMAMLAAVPGSVLWLLAGPDGFADNLRRAAQEAGIDPARLIFASLAPHDEHLARLALADLFVDTLSYNGHTTASDALWAGTPVVTCLGATFPARVAASLLTAAGLPELIAPNVDDYTQLAIALAGDAVRLDGLRQRLIDGRASCALFDTKATTRQIEAAYRAMWDAHVAGLSPKSFTVAP